MEKAYELEFTGKKTGSLFLNCCGVSKTEPFHSFGPAQKPHFVIHYIISGKGRFTMNNTEYALEPGYGFMIPPEELVYYHADAEDPWYYLWVGFSGELAEATLKDIGLTISNPIFSMENGDGLYKIVKDMMEHNSIGVSNELRRNGGLQLFLANIAENATIEDRASSDDSDSYVRKAVAFIQGNYCNPIKVTDIADYVCINRSYLYTLFKDATGFSPQQFLTTFRITKASELLQLTELSVESIAMSCGYQDPIVFNKAFKQMRGMSPTAYRAEMQKGETRKNKEYLKQIEDFITQVYEIHEGDRDEVNKISVKV